MTNNVLEYKGYIAQLALDTDDNIIVGNTINTADIISFHGDTINEATQAFHDVLDTYLQTCEDESIDPSRPYSGKFNLRIEPQMHRELSIEATKSGKSLNELVASMIKESLSHDKRI